MDLETGLTFTHGHSNYTVKTFGLLQPYFGHLSCMPVVCVTHYKLEKDASYLNQSISVVEKPLLNEDLHTESFIH